MFKKTADLVKEVTPNLATNYQVLVYINCIPGHKLSGVNPLPPSFWHSQQSMTKQIICGVNHQIFWKSYHFLERI